MAIKIVSIPMVFDRERFGKDCRLARLGANLTQDEAGAMIGMSGKWISNVERGYEHALTVRSLEIIANLYDLRIDHYWVLRDGKPASGYGNR